MLAQSFLSAIDLEITEPQRDALIGVLGMLERGELKHVLPDDTNSNLGSLGHPFEGKFNMRYWDMNFPGCGTVCCIGGTAEKVYGVNFFNGTKMLNKLFFSFPGCDVKFYNITISQAARALRSYLTIGDPCWKEAINEA